MRPRLTATVMLAAMLLAACGGASPASAPGATTADGGQATPGGQATDPAAQATQSGGGGGSGGGGTGSVRFQISGSAQETGELPFFAFGSRFGGPAGVALHFTIADGDGSILTIVETQGTWGLSYVTEQYGLSWGNCATFNVEIAGESAVGSFDCSDGIGTRVSDGSLISGAGISGTFEARA